MAPFDTSPQGLVLPYLSALSFRQIQQAVFIDVIKRVAKMAPALSLTFGFSHLD
jgi:hypothetical protein